MARDQPTGLILCQCLPSATYTKGNLIYSCDVIERIEELSESDELSDDEREELASLQALADEAAGYAPDWEYGETLIRDSYFKEYAQDLAEDLGLMDDNASWPYSCIDWEQAARELQMDYTAVEFDGVTYWIR